MKFVTDAHRPDRLGIFTLWGKALRGWTYAEAEKQVRNVEVAARTMGLQIVVLKGNNASGNVHNLD